MNSIMKYGISILIGALVGFLGGFQGIAGGFYISVLIMATGIVPDQRKAAGTTLLAILFPLSIGAVYQYWKSGDIDIPVALLITFTYAIFATFGAIYNKKVTGDLPLISLSFLMALTSVYFGYRGYKAYYKIK